MINSLVKKRHCYTQCHVATVAWGAGTLGKRELANSNQMQAPFWAAACALAAGGQGQSQLAVQGYQLFQAGGQDQTKAEGTFVLEQQLVFEVGNAVQVVADLLEKQVHLVDVVRGAKGDYQGPEQVAAEGYPVLDL